MIMFNGIKLFNGKNINEIQVENFVEKIKRELGINFDKFEFSEKNTEKRKKIKSIEKAFKLLKNDNYYSLTVTSSENVYSTIYTNLLADRNHQKYDKQQ